MKSRTICLRLKKKFRSGGPGGASVGGPRRSETSWRKDAGGGGSCKKTIPLCLARPPSTWLFAAGRYLGRKALESRAGRTWDLPECAGERAGAEAATPVPLGAGLRAPPGAQTPGRAGAARPEAARFLPGGATAPEQLRRRRLGAGGPGWSAGAATYSRSPFPAAQGKAEQAAPSPGSDRWEPRRRAAPAAGAPGRREEGRAGRGARPRGPAPPAAARVGASRAGRRRRRAPAWARLPRRAGSEGPLGLTGPPRPDLSFPPRRLLRDVSRGQSAGEEPGVTEEPILARREGPGRKADYRLLGRWTEGARPRRRPWATLTPCWNFSPRRSRVLGSGPRPS